MHLKVHTHTHTHTHTHARTHAHARTRTDERCDLHNKLYYFTDFAASFNSLDGSYAAFNPASFLSEKSCSVTIINVTLRPENADGLIVYWESYSNDFISLLLRNRKVEFHYSLGTGTAVVSSDYLLSLYGWYTIRAERQLKTGT